MAAPVTAVLDACVLHSAPLRDLFMQLALADLFHARWTDRIHAECLMTLEGQGLIETVTRLRCFATLI